MNDAVQTWSYSARHLGLQSLAAAELRVTDRVAVFGGVRAELRYIAALVTYPTAGVRIGF